ncbi:MAG: hypothetical protein V5B78_01650 [Desulfohalobiaceae bacterium]
MRTHITVRVKTKDAKFLGSSMGGALVTLRDARTRELLASGRTTGSTGDTERIMKRPNTVRDVISDMTSACFRTELDLAEPRLVEVTAYGPLAQTQSAMQCSSQQWVIPGKHISEGDAWMLVLTGLAVDIFHPPAHSGVSASEGPLELWANVIML